MSDILNSNSEGLKIQLANCVFVSENFQMDSNYKNEIKIAFKCEVQTLDYQKMAETCKTIINGWVKRCTNGKIKDLFSSLVCEKGYELVCVIVSCIYFKSDWYDKSMSHNNYDDSFCCTEKKNCYY